jgi:glycosyltransferase involved in cell wall biosynthesis
MKKINIAYITKEDSQNKIAWSGTSHNIYRCLYKTGHNIIRFGPYNSFFEKFLKLVELFYKLLNVKYDPDRNIFMSKIISKRIKENLKNKKIDLIVVHDCPIISFLKTEIPIVIWTDLTFDLYQRSYFNNYKKFHPNSITQGNYLEKLSLNKANTIIYSTKYAEINAKKKYSIKKNKIKIIPFGSDILPISKKKFLFVQKNRIMSKKKIIKFISVGVDWERKNMDKSIQVIRELNNIGNKCSLIIVGALPPKNFIKPKFVKIIPFLDKKIKKNILKLKELYLNSDYFILLSKAEAFGLVIQEATAHGLPLILNNIDGMRYVADKKYSLFVNKDNSPFKIASKIANLDNNLSKYRKLSYNSHSSSFNNNWDVVSGKLSNLINNIILKKI